MAILIIILLIILNGYFSLAEIALVSVNSSEFTGEKFKDNRKAAQVLRLIRDPEGFLSAVQVGITLLGLVEGIYGGNIVAVELEEWFIHIGMSQSIAHLSSLVLGIGSITYLTIVFGELVPKSIALQLPVKISLAIAPSLNLFSRILYPFIKLLTVSTRFILDLFKIKNTNNKKITEKDLKMILGTAYQQGVLGQQQLFLHQNVFTFKDLTAKRIMKPARIVASVQDNWSYPQVKEFIKETPYSYFPVFSGDQNNIIGVVSTKVFLLNDETDWLKNLQDTCMIPPDMPAKDIFNIFKQKRMDFGVVVNGPKQYLGIVAMQDIMEGIFGDMPELEDYADFFYKQSDKVWIAEGFIHLQRIRNTLSLAWLRDYEVKYLDLAELMAGETYGKDGPLVLNGVIFKIIEGTKEKPQKISISLP